MDRDTLGRVVRDAWIGWARTQLDQKPSWLAPYDELSEPDKEADRQIAEAVLRWLNTRRIELAEKKSVGTLSPDEEEEFAALQEGVFGALEAQHPRKRTDTARLDEIERRLKG